jgi:hypothetical protein
VPVRYDGIGRFHACAALLDCDQIAKPIWTETSCCRHARIAYLSRKMARCPIVILKRSNGRRWAAARARTESERGYRLLGIVEICRTESRRRIEGCLEHEGDKKLGTKLSTAGVSYAEAKFLQGFNNYVELKFSSTTATFLASSGSCRKTSCCRRAAVDLVCGLFTRTRYTSQGSPPNGRGSGRDRDRAPCVLSPRAVAPRCRSVLFAPVALSSRCCFALSLPAVYPCRVNNPNEFLPTVHILHSEVGVPLVRGLRSGDLAVTKTGSLPSGCDHVGRTMRRDGGEARIIFGIFAPPGTDRSGLVYVRSELKTQHAQPHRNTLSSLDEAVLTSTLARQRRSALVWSRREC